MSLYVMEACNQSTGCFPSKEACNQSTGCFPSKEACNQSTGCFPSMEACNQSTGCFPYASFSGAHLLEIFPTLRVSLWITLWWNESDIFFSSLLKLLSSKIIVNSTIIPCLHMQNDNFANTRKLVDTIVKSLMYQFIHLARVLQEAG